VSRSLIQQTIQRRPEKPPAETVPALWRGLVIEVLDDGTAWVTIPRLGGTDAFGPLPSIPDGLTPGEPVLIGAVEGMAAEMLVVNRIADRTDSRLKSLEAAFTTLMLASAMIIEDPDRNGIYIVGRAADVSEDPNDPGFFFIGPDAPVTEDPADPGLYLIGD